MSDRAPYSRVYWSVADDPKFVGIYDDDAAFALWVRLLMTADALWPAPAPLPRSARPRPLSKLVDAGLIDRLSGDRYRVHGLDAERQRRATAAYRGPRRDPTGTHSGTQTRRDELRQDETSIPPPPAERGRRKDGTNPRATGSSPRQNGHAPRDIGESPRQVQRAEKRGGLEALSAIVAGVAAVGGGDQ